MIQGTKVTRPLKRELANDIAVALGIPKPAASRGSSIDSTFLDRVHEALGHIDTAGADAYRKTESVLNDLGLTYDPFWDTSEAQEAGGSTVTNRAFSRIRAAATQTPRCFILNTTDAPVGAKWETDHQSIYRYDGGVTGRRSFNDAGPGSLLIYYSTGKSTYHPKHFIAAAMVDYIAPGWTGPWEARIADYTEFPTPVSVDDLDLPGWNRQHSLTEITWETYQALVNAGDAPSTASAPTSDRGSDITAERVRTEFPASSETPRLEIPDSLPSGVMILEPASEPVYVEDPNTSTATSSDLPPRPSKTENNRAAEKRAVDLTRAALEADGWVLARDCQKLGTGYDLEYTKGADDLHVEVKGIQSTTLAFNMTPKESWRLETDPCFVVVAVTSVLSPHDYNLHLLTREHLAKAKRVVTGFRLTF